MDIVNAALWIVTFITVVVMLSRSYRLTVEGCRWWLRPTMSLVFRLPVFLLALLVTAIGIAFVYNINSRAWISVEKSGLIYLRFWLLLLAPLVLSIASLGFTVPLLGYFVVIPLLYRNKKFGVVLRFFLSTLIIFGIPLLMYWADIVFLKP